MSRFARRAPRASRPHRARRSVLAAVPVALVCVLLAACGSSSKSSGGSGTEASAPAAKGAIVAVGAENEYADVIGQVGGRYVKVSAVMSDPNTDPHTFEASPSVARTVSQAKLVVQNGVGYDDFMNKIEKASGGKATVIEAQTLLHLPDSTPNPHLWYDPRTMPAVAQALEAKLSALMPSHASYFKANEQRFMRSLQPWFTDIKTFDQKHPGAAVATTEPVSDYMLQAAHIRNLTPFSLQANIMNGNDLAPQAVTAQNDLFSAHRVKAFVYNEQVTESVTKNFRSKAAAAHVPLVGVYETMPPGFTYQRWMMAELNAIGRAVDHGVSTPTL